MVYGLWFKVEGHGCKVQRLMVPRSEFRVGEGGENCRGGATPLDFGVPS